MQAPRTGNNKQQCLWGREQLRTSQRGCSFSRPRGQPGLSRCRSWRPGMAGSYLCVRVLFLRPPSLPLAEAAAPVLHPSKPRVAVVPAPGISLLSHFPTLHAHGFSSAQRLLLSLSLVQTPLLRAYQPSGSLSGWSCHIHLQSGRVAGEFTSTCSYPCLLSSTTQSPGLLPLTSSQGSSCPIFLLALLSFFCLGPCTSRLWGPMVSKPLQVLSAPFPVTFCPSTST